MSDVFPYYPELNQYVIFKKRYPYYDSINSASEVTVGEIGKILKVEISNIQYSGEVYVVVGLSNGRIIEINITIHNDLLEPVPDSPTARVLYGVK